MNNIFLKPGDNVCVDPTVKDRKYISVPKGHVWVAGDNLSNSFDSRGYGPVPMGLIKGRVFAKVFLDIHIYISLIFLFQTALATTSITEGYCCTYYLRKRGYIVYTSI